MIKLRFPNLRFIKPKIPSLHRPAIYRNFSTADESEFIENESDLAYPALNDDIEKNLPKNMQTREDYKETKNEEVIVETTRNSSFKPLNVSILAMRCFYQFSKQRPDIWNENSLSKAFGISPKEMRMYLKNGELEEKIKNGEGEGKSYGVSEVDESLHGAVYALYGNPHEKYYYPTKVLLNSVINKRTGMVGYEKKNMLFGCREEKELVDEMTYKTPRLVKRDTFKDGPGSGKQMENINKIRPLKKGVLVTDISRMKGKTRKNTEVPIYVRNKDGTMRFSDRTEYDFVIKQEIFAGSEVRFSPA